MKKKSKKRIPQDIRPWARLKSPEEGFSVPIKQATRWVAGSRRDWNTKILRTKVTDELSSIILKAFTGEIGDPAGTLLQQKINKKLRGYNKMGMLCRYKNYCAFTGRARTFNRILYMARHSMRKLAGIGLISGFIK